MTSDQWPYLHKNIIFLVIILILKHVLFRLMQKYLSPVINYLLCRMNCYSWGVIRSSHPIRTRSHRIRIVVKFYNRTLRLRYGCIGCRTNVNQPLSFPNSFSSTRSQIFLCQILNYIM